MITWVSFYSKTVAGEHQLTTLLNQPVAQCGQDNHTDWVRCHTFYSQVHIYWDSVVSLIVATANVCNILSAPIYMNLSVHDNCIYHVGRLSLMFLLIVDYITGQVGPSLPE